MEIGVYGLGRFGYFWADLLSSRYSVRAFSRNPERPTPLKVTRVGLTALMDSDVVFLCTAISSMEEVLKEISPLVSPRTLIVDTCSVKVKPAQWMKDILPAHSQIVACHPMFGPDSAKQGVKGLPIVLYNVQKAEAELDYWVSSFKSMGMDVLLMSPEEHDRSAAYTQGLTHLIGRLLAELNAKPNPIATKGYKSLLEILEQTCNDPMQLFLDLQTYNPYTKDMRKDVLAGFEKIQGVLENRLDTRDREG